MRFEKRKLLLNASIRKATVRVQSGTTLGVMKMHKNTVVNSQNSSKPTSGYCCFQAALYRRKS